MERMKEFLERKGLLWLAWMVVVLVIFSILIWMGNAPFSILPFMPILLQAFPLPFLLLASITVWASGEVSNTLGWKKVLIPASLCAAAFLFVKLALDFTLLNFLHSTMGVSMEVSYISCAITALLVWFALFAFLVTRLSRQARVSLAQKRIVLKTITLVVVAGLFVALVLYTNLVIYPEFADIALSANNLDDVALAKLNELSTAMKPIRFGENMLWWLFAVVSVWRFEQINNGT